MNTSTSHTIYVSQSDLVGNDVVSQYYSQGTIEKILKTTLDYMNSKIHASIALPYFQELDVVAWQSKPKELNIYLTDITEGRALNLDARGKDYATNILSYPSDLPLFILEEMPSIPLGELVICHDVVVQEAQAQNKSINDHVTHLIVHGILHLLGFDHELGQTEQDEMESFEIAVLEELGIANPYIDNTK